MKILKINPAYRPANKNPELPKKQTGNKILTSEAKIEKPLLTISNMLAAQGSENI